MGAKWARNKREMRVKPVRDVPQKGQQNLIAKNVENCKLKLLDFPDDGAS
ncbi:MAG: hypothetical protein Fur0046_06250 [Cyanobacteria bacterium J069]